MLDPQHPEFQPDSFEGPLDPVTIAFERATRTRELQSPALERQIRLLAVSRRRAGHLPEQVVVEVKQLVRRHGTSLTFAEFSELSDWAVHWAIDAYFRVD